MTTAVSVASVLRGYRFNYGTEMQLHEGIQYALEGAGHMVEREVVLLGGLGRIDMLVDEVVGVEVKISGGPAGVARQLARYLKSDLLVGVVLVTGRVAHLAITDPRLEVVSLAGGGL